MSNVPTVKMEKWMAAPNAKVVGFAFLSLFNTLKHDEIQPLLEKYKLTDVQGEAWYPQQLLFDIEKDIAENLTNVSENLVAIGMNVTGVLPFPVEVNSVETALSALTSSYEVSHQNVWPEEKAEVKFVEERHVQVVYNSPYPADLLYGFIWGIMRRYTPKDMKFRVTKSNPPGNPTMDIFDVQWGNKF